MAFAAAAIPIAMSVLGAMSKKDEPQGGEQRPPTPGELMTMNQQSSYMGPSDFAMPNVSPYMQTGPIGGGQRGNNG
jgi:hypothetical protein